MQGVVKVLAAVICSILITNVITPGLRAENIQLFNLEPTERKFETESFPVSTGIIFEKGKLTSTPGGILVDQNGKDIPFTFEVTGWWEKEKKNIKWLLLHFQADSSKNYTFVTGGTAKAPTGKTLAQDTEETITIDTGPLQAVISKKEAALFESVTAGGKILLNKQEEALKLVIFENEKPVTCYPREWEVVLEESTLFQASVKATRVYLSSDKNQPITMLDLRYIFYKDQPFIRIYQTVTWMVKDVNIGIRELSLNLKQFPEKQISVSVITILTAKILR
ncbi:MAG: hypothetical protein ACYTFY_21400 [Planctomycetota bacterium]|jgi:hypothetical protein